MEAAAVLDLVGNDGWAFLTTRDPTERIVRDAVASKAAELAGARDRALAARIAINVARALAGKSVKG